MVIDWSDNIVRSIVLGTIAFLASLLVLSVYKPRTVTKEKQKVDNPKMITISTIVALTTTLVVFLVLNDDIIEYKPEKKASMKFGANY